ncbi:tail fiber protein [Bradyrhizobium sp. 192]|nr:tail fiber protein [Bradyrhizobium sp. 192]
MASPLASSSMLREDISGAIVTGGTSTAYTVASFRKYGSLAELDGNIIAFTPHVTNALGSPHVSLNVDGLGAKSLRADPTRELPPGVLIAGTPYTARYDNVNGLFLLHGVFGTPYNIPLGGGLDYWGATAPSSAFAFPVGQAISRAIYADLFALLGTTYGTGDGSTTFNLPDKRGRVSASADAMGGIAAGRLTDAVAGIDSPGDAGGAQSHTLSAGQIPSITSTNGSQGITVGTTGGLGMPAITGGWAGLGAGTGSFQTAQFNGAQSPQTISSLSGNNSISVTSSNTGGGAHNNVQPTIICNYIIRVL